MEEDQIKDVQCTFALRASLGTCLAKLKAMNRTALAMFPLLYHATTAPLGGSGDEDLYSAAQPNTSFDEMVKCTERLHHAVHVWGLSGCHDWPPLINGSQVTFFHPACIHVLRLSCHNWVPSLFRLLGLPAAALLYLRCEENVGSLHAEHCVPAS